jgi:uncharacterized protein
MPVLNEQLQALIQLQDTDIMLRDAQDPEFAKQEERLGLLRENVKHLERTRRRLASRVDGQLLRTYERMSRKFSRVVVPIEGNVCVGCRMSLPTSARTRNAPTATIENCENCGRILYRF